MIQLQVRHCPQHQSVNSPLHHWPYSFHSWIIFKSFFLPKKYKRYILAIQDIDWRYVMATSLAKQYNFKINETAMEQARAIIKEKGMTMTDAISLFVEQIVLEQDFPIKTAKDLHREQLIEELQVQSERALREYEAGEGTSLDNMRVRYGL